MAAEGRLEKLKVDQLRSYLIVQEAPGPLPTEKQALVERVASIIENLD